MTKVMEEIIRITGKMGMGHKDLKINPKHFRREKTFKVGKFALTPYLMDHSASESFAFVIEAEGKRLIYTGDYREHGHRGKVFKSFLEKDFGPIDLILTEGTQALVEKGETGKDIMFKIEKKMKSGALYVMCSGQNIDLLCTLGGIADRKGRFLVVDGYMALILDTFKTLLPKSKIPNLEKDYLKILDIPATKNVKKYYPETYKKMEGKLVSWDWVNENISRAIIPVRTYSEKWVKANIKDFTNGTFIYSMWEGYTEEAGFKKTIDAFLKLGIKKESEHVSGHAYFSTIRKLMEKKNPRYIIPVHTEHPEKFKEVFGDRVQILKNGEIYEL